MMNFKDFFRQFLTERTNVSKGCAMAYFEKDTLDKFQKQIETTDLYDEEGFGLEGEPHCTLLYGFLKDNDPQDIIDTLKLFNYPKSVKLINCSLFENDDYDVLKFDVQDDSGVLEVVNSTLEHRHKYENDYPDYHPHCTVAYLQKGMGKKYVKMFGDKELTVDIQKMVYSDTDNKVKSFRP